MVEAQAEQEADRVHLPRRVDPAGQRAEEPVHQAALVQLLLELLVVVGAAAHLAEDLEDPGQDDEVEPGDQEQEEPGHAGADDVGGVLQVGAAVFDLLVQAADAEVEQHGQREDHAGVAQGEEEPHRQRSLALTGQLAGGVVDGRDVIGVERVPHAQGVGQRPGAHAEHRRLADVVVAAQGGGQHPPADHVQPDDRGDHAAEPGPLGRGQSLADPGQAAALVSHAVTLRRS
jgi:hypothetical protein